MNSIGALLSLLIFLIHSAFSIDMSAVTDGYNEGTESNDNCKLNPLELELKGSWQFLSFPGETEDGHLCLAFHFRWENFNQGECKHDVAHEKYWCATNLTSDGMPDKWGYCDPATPCIGMPDDCNMDNENNHLFSQGSDGALYFRSDYKMRWYNAIDYCQHYGATLAHANTQEEFDAILTFSDDRVFVFNNNLIQ